MKTRWLLLLVCVVPCLVALVGCKASGGGTSTDVTAPLDTPGDNSVLINALDVAQIEVADACVGCGDSDEGMATTDDPEAYCWHHPGALPECAELDLEACSAHPFCSPVDAIECGWTDPPGYEIIQVGCGTIATCAEDGSGRTGVTCTGMVWFGSSPDTGVWYMFFSGCGPDGWEAAGSEPEYCEVPP